MDKKYLEVGDVAKAMNVVTASVRAWVRSGDLKVAAFTERGTRLFRREDFDAFRRLRRQREKARARASHFNAPAA